MNKKIVVFGAGKIGRSFIGQLFSVSGFEVVFIDANRELVDGLNEKKSYKVVAVSDNSEEIILVSNIRALHSSEENKILEEIIEADFVSVSVGKNIVSLVVPNIAHAVAQKFTLYPDRNTDIIIAENMRAASEFFRNELLKYLPDGFPIQKRIGLIETSIGKMVPDIERSSADELTIFTEPYNSLLVDKDGFRNLIPKIKGLVPKSDFQAWVDRKAFIHNLGHASIAYFGNFRHKKAEYMYEVMQDQEVVDFGKAVMNQAAEILLLKYPGAYTREELIHHIEDLLQRFNNKSLSDTVRRVADDVSRKLGPDDRFVGIIKIAREYGGDFQMILRAMSYALVYSVNENSYISEKDKKLGERVRTDIKGTLTSVLGLDSLEDKEIIDQIAGNFHEIMRSGNYH